MQGSKANFFTKANKRKSFDDQNWERQGSVKNREKSDKNKQARRQANRQEKDD